MKKFVLFFTVVAFIAVSNGCGNSGSQKKTSETRKEEKSQSDEQATLKVQGSCGMCKTRIEKAAKSIDGVTVANWNKDSQQLHLQFNAKKTSVDAVSKAIAKTGHDTEKDSADDVVYNALPGCCKYRPKV
ncbi:MAG: copper chaperone [Odoribacteraceae bacterium]|jgi:Cu(I)/Ag(I) efflux system membrane fusion protein|nr:copper chaperone [Odoribacteraceae bacterium]